MGLRNWTKSKKAKAMVVLGSFALLLGVGASVAVTNSVEENEAVETKAATSTTVYYAVPSATVNNFNVKCNVNRKGDGDDWAQYDMERTRFTFSGDLVYTCTFTDLYNGLGNLQFQLYDGSTWKSQVAPISSWTAASTYNGKVWKHGGSTWQTATWDANKTIYFDGGSLHSTYASPKVYAFDATGWKNAAWPGEEMTSSGKSIYGGSFWSTSVPSGATVVFNPGGDDGKTEDLSLSSVASGMAFLIATKGVGNWYTPLTLRTINQDTSTTTDYRIYKNGSTGIGFTMPSLSKTGYTAKWNTNAAGTGTDYTPGATDQKFTANLTTLYSKFTINTYTINYTFVVDGVPQTDRRWNGSSWADGSLTGSTSANYGTLFNALAEPTLYGASFDGWYSDSTCKTALSTTAISKNYGATEAYAKFTTDSSSSNLYVGIDGSVGQNKYLLRSWSADAQGYTWVYYTNGTKSAGIKVQELTSISVSGWKYFRFRVPSDTTSVVLCKGEWGTTGAYQAQTIDLHPGSGTTTTTDSYANGHNLFVVGSTQTGNAKRTGEWKDIQYYLDVASSTDFKSNLTTHTMSAPNNPSTGNTAEVMKVSVPNGYYVRGKYVVNGTTGYNITKGGEDGSSSSSVYSEQTSGVGVHFKAAKTCNFYINTSGDIWIVDCSGITAGGYLYISTQLTPAQIKVDCSVGGSDYFSGAKLSTVDDVLSTTTLTYDGVKGLIIVPIYHLRKGETKPAGTTYSITLTSASDSSRTTSVTGVTVNSSNKVYTINLSTASSWSASTAVSETYGSVATLAYDIDAAVKAAENGSVCNVFESTASALATRYNTLAATSDYRTKLEAASIESYNYGWSKGVGTYEKGVMISNGSKGTIGLAYIYAELCSRGDVTATYAPAGARAIPNKKEDSPLTLTLWIVLSAGILGLGAIGAAYFVSKKKNRANA